MKLVNLIVLLVTLMLFSGCSDKLQTMTTPKYENTKQPVSSIGITGPGATLAIPSFIRYGFKVKELTVNQANALAEAKTRKIPFVAVVDAAGGETATWNGFYSYGIRVYETAEENIVWSAHGSYGEGGVFINKVKSTNDAMNDMIGNFSKTFVPAQ